MSNAYPTSPSNLAALAAADADHAAEFQFIQSGSKFFEFFYGGACVGCAWKPATFTCKTVYAGMIGQGEQLFIYNHPIEDGDPKLTVRVR